MPNEPYSIESLPIERASLVKEAPSYPEGMPVSIEEDNTILIAVEPISIDKSDIE